MENLYAAELMGFITGGFVGFLAAWWMASRDLRQAEEKAERYINYWRKASEKLERIQATLDD